MATDSQTWTTTSSWQAPAGVNIVQAECWGPGGNGIPGNDPGNHGGEGGGGGAYAKTNSITVIPGKSYAIQMTENFAVEFEGENSEKCVADYGRVGLRGTGGAGGSSANCTGDTKVSGGNGGIGPSTGAGGGGGCAGANGANGVGDTGGAGGAGANGGGDGGDGGDYNTAGEVPTPPPGGGGGGAGYPNGTTRFGATSQIKLTWTVPTNINVCSVQ